MPFCALSKDGAKVLLLAQIGHILTDMLLSYYSHYLFLYGLCAVTKASVCGISVSVQGKVMPT